MSDPQVIVKVFQGEKFIEVIPPSFGQVVLTFHDGKIKLVEETKKTQIK